MNAIEQVSAIWDRQHSSPAAVPAALEELKTAIGALAAEDLPPVISWAFDLASSGHYQFWIIYATATIEQCARSLACPDCTSEVRGFAGSRWRYRVVHSGSCPWYRRYLGGEVWGRIPCGGVVAHRGPYRRRPPI